MKKSLFILLSFLTLAACNKQIDDIHPLTKIDKDGELASVAGIVETTVGNYSLLFGSGFNSYDAPLMDISEDRGNNVTLRQWGLPNQNTDAFLFVNSNSPTLGNSSQLFRGAYQLIVSVNTTLEGIATFEKTGYASLTDDDKNKMLYAKGENIYLRALTYFNLSRIYGKPYYQDAAGSLAVPLKTTSDIKDMPAPSSVKDLYTFIISELQTAAQLMKVPVTKTNAFANTAAAWGLLSRVYLYMGGSIANPDAGSNQLAVTYADSVISQTGGKYTLLQGSDYANMFGDDEDGSLGRANGTKNKEIIFALDNSQGGTSIGALYHYDPIYGVGGYLLPSTDLNQSFDPADVRGTFFKLNTSSGYVETTKWLVLPNYTSSRAPNIQFRLAEAYLNRAEANAKLNNTTLAKADLKVIHTRAGLPASDIDNLADGDVISAVLKERRWELAFEGHNSYDYFRNGLPMHRIAADFNGTALTIQPDDPKVVFTVPTN